MDNRMAVKFYVTVVQEVLLFGLKTWVVTPQIDKSLTGLHYQDVCRMVGMIPEFQLNRTRVYLPIGAALLTV